MQKLPFIVVVGDIIVIILCLRAAVKFGAILKKHDDYLDSRKNCNGDGKNVKATSEPSKLDCLLYEPRRLLVKLGCCLRRKNILTPLAFKKCAGNIEAVWRRQNKRLKLLVAHSMKIWCSHKRKQPNDKSSGTREDKP